MQIRALVELRRGWRNLQLDFAGNLAADDCQFCRRLAVNFTAEMQFEIGTKCQVGLWVLT